MFKSNKNISAASSPKCSTSAMIAFLIGSFMRPIPCKRPFESVDSEKNKIVTAPTCNICAAVSDESRNKSCKIGDASMPMPTATWKSNHHDKTCCNPDLSFCFTFFTRLHRQQSVHGNRGCLPSLIAMEIGNIDQNRIFSSINTIPGTILVRGISPDMQQCVLYTA